MRITRMNFKSDQLRPGITTTAIGAVDNQSSDRNSATVSQKSRGGKLREKRKVKSVGLRVRTLQIGTMTGKTFRTG